MMMMSVSDLFHDCVEAIFLVGGICNDAVGSIGFVQSVLALDDVAIAVLPLRLVVAGLGVLHSVFVFVGRVVVGVVLFMSVMLVVMLLDVFVRSIVMTWFAWVLFKRLKIIVQPTVVFNDVLSVMSPFISSVMFVMDDVHWVLHLELVVSLWLTSRRHDHEGECQNYLKEQHCHELLPTMFG